MNIHSKFITASFLSVSHRQHWPEPVGYHTVFALDSCHLCDIFLIYIYSFFFFLLLALKGIVK